MDQIGVELEKLSAQKLKYGSLPKDVHKRRDAVLALSEAVEIIETDKKMDAQVTAIEANRLSPDLVPAVLVAKEYLADKSRKKNAIKVIKKAWESQLILIWQLSFQKFMKEKIQLIEKRGSSRSLK